MTDANATGGFKLEVGKYYRTRDGRKVGPVWRSRDDKPYYVALGDISGCWNANGVAFSWEGDDDLVAEWVEGFKADEEHQRYRGVFPPAPQPAIDNPQAVDGGDDKPAGGRFDVEVHSGYYPLFRVLEEALDQSQAGKERHVRGDIPFIDQPILSITRMVGPGGPAFLTIKKVQEACGMIERGEHDRAVRELLGAIVCTAAMVIAVREKKEGGDAS